MPRDGTVYSHMPYLGETAALATALLWAFTTLFFAEAGRRIGSFQVNVIRLGIAVGLYAVFVPFVVTDTPGLMAATRSQWFWMILSGVVGLAVGDGCGFKALVMIGPRLTTLLYASAPVWATIIAWIFLGETLGGWHLLGMAMTLGGIAWVILERRYESPSGVRPAADHPDSGSLGRGVLMGTLAGLSQATGLVMAKQAIMASQPPLDPMAVSFGRMLAACGSMLVWALILGRGGRLVTALRDWRAIGQCAGGATVGPFLGVWMSLVAVSLIATGVAATLNAMTPVMILPIVVWFYGERVSPRAVAGAVLAVAGAAVLYLVP